MPTVLRSGSYRFYFYSHEANEPPHVHVDRDDLSAKLDRSGRVGQELRLRRTRTKHARIDRACEPGALVGGVAWVFGQSRQMKG
jgi:Domain of unknown function (DUF4160)